MLFSLFIFLAFSTSATIAVTTFTTSASDKILLQDVNILIFEKNKLSTSRRSAPVHQLNCLRGCAAQYEPQKIVCHNAGSNGIDVQWKCEATLPAGLKLGRVEVVCEGYDSQIDKYVLAGSCGLEYEIEHHIQQQQSGGALPTNRTHDVDVIAAFIIFFCVCFVVMVCICCGEIVERRQEVKSRVRVNRPVVVEEEGIAGGGVHHHHHHTNSPRPSVIYARAPPPSVPSFTDGMIVGSMLNRPSCSSSATSSRVVHHPPTPHPSAPPSQPPRSSTETSVSYGGTRRR